MEVYIGADIQSGFMYMKVCNCCQILVCVTFKNKPPFRSLCVTFESLPPSERSRILLIAPQALL